MILENYKAFELAKSLGFVLNKNTGMWDWDHKGKHFIDYLNKKIDIDNPGFYNEEQLINNKIPFKIGKIDGDFHLSNNPINSAENFPIHVTGI